MTRKKIEHLNCHKDKMSITFKHETSINIKYNEAFFHKSPIVKICNFSNSLKTKKKVKERTPLEFLIAGCKFSQNFLLEFH